MTRTISLLLTISLGLSGTSYAQALSRSPEGSADYWMQYTGRLPIGATVTVRTVDGRRMTAVLAIVDDTGITVHEKTRVPVPPRHIPFADLSQVELKQNQNVAKAVAIGVATGAATFFGILLIVAATIGD